MGQKINPLGFRLGTNQNHYSVWFAKSKTYFENIREDKKIRDYIKNYIEKKTSRKTSSSSIHQSVAGIVRIEIQKRSDVIKIIIHIAFVDLILEDVSQRLQELQMNIQKELNCMNQKFNITIIKIATPYGHANIIAKYLGEQLKKRVSFRKAMKKAIELSEKATAKGIRLQISGRINGKEMARVEWTKAGRVPLHTIGAKMDYCSYPVRTIYGVLGIKIWIVLDEPNKALI